MAEHEVVKRLKDLADQIDNAKSASAETTKILEHSERVVACANKGARLLDTSKHPRRKARRVGQKR